MAVQIQTDLLYTIVQKHPDAILLDAEDYERFRFNKVYKCELGYFYITIKGKRYSMQQAVTDFKYAQVDHKNGIPWDCRKENLREATHQQNAQNVGKKSNNTSGYKGVTWDKHANKWKVSIAVNGKQKHIGSFVYKDNAIEAYARAARIYHKEFANA